MKRLFQKQHPNTNILKFVPLRENDSWVGRNFHYNFFFEERKKERRKMLMYIKSAGSKLAISFHFGNEKFCSFLEVNLAQKTMERLRKYIPSIATLVLIGSLQTFATEKNNFIVSKMTRKSQ